MLVQPADLAAAIRSVSREEFSRSGGPGGQNVNKVNTQVTLRVPVAELCNAMAWQESERKRIETRLANRINDSGELITQVSDTRSQNQNREIAVERVVELVTEALRRERRRRPTSPTRAARERRLEAKRRRASIKNARKAPDE